MGRGTSRTALGAVFVAWLAGSVFAASATVKGRVTAEGGGSIQEAQVLFHHDIAGQGVGLFEAEPPAMQGRSVQYPDVLHSTDAKGQFKVQLRPGFYDVCVFSTGFSPKCSKIMVESSKTLVYDVRLKIDALVEKYIGDTFRH
jgi:hypothetical protein